MPTTKSAKKALRQSTRRRIQNLAKKRALKTEVKKYRRLVAAHNAGAAHKTLPRLYKLLDKAAKTHLIKKNAARRLKSRLAKLSAKTK